MNHKALATEILEVRGSTPCSEPYKHGLIHILKVRHQKVLGTYKKSSGIPYRVGTANADAYFYGCERGHVEWNRLVDERPEVIESLSQ